MSERFDYSEPFEVSVEVDRVPVVSTGMDDAVVVLIRLELFWKLPFGVTSGFFYQVGDPDDERKSEVWFNQPYRVGIRYRIVPPALFKPVSLPETAELSFGPASFAQRVQTLDDGVIEITYEFDSGKRRWSLEDLTAFQKAAKP
jgi:hypothetical protein